MRRVANAIKFDDSLIAYLLAIVEETRNHEAFELGVSPRGAVSLRRAAQARALVDGRDFCIPEDIRDHALCVLGHRIALDPRSVVRRGTEETEWILREILERVAVPL